MGLSRQSCVPLKQRLRVSFWASVGAACLAGALCAAWRGWQDYGATPDDAVMPRRLISEMYPKDLVLSRPYYDDTNSWLVILHCIGIGYMLLGLNTVCDVYFTGSLEVMTEKWKIKPDVAGATFMAAGGSAPELFTSLIGATVESDVGFSTIVGSAVFNVLFVIGLCGVYAKEEMVLTWWPLFRDCSYYIFGLSALAAFSADGSVKVYESITLFVLYICYCTIMYHNTRLEGFVDSRLRRARKQVAPAESYTVSSEDAAEGPNSLAAPQSTSYGKMEDDADDNPPETTPEVTPEVSPEEAAAADGEAAAKEEEEEEEEEESFIARPSGVVPQIIWGLSLPVYAPLYYLTPEPTERWFLATFLVSLAWIAGFSFLLVWWVEILGDIIFGGRDSASIVMGFTVLAAGTSIPDAVSSVAVARIGEGDMAVSSSIGSNIFDILVGLPIPWTIKILFLGSKEVKITSPYLFFYVVLLLGMVLLTIGSIHFQGWRLNKKLGVMMAMLYGVFLSVALSVEFGKPDALRWGETS